MTWSTWETTGSATAVGLLISAISILMNRIPRSDESSRNLPRVYSSEGWCR